jgi:hypothetical protein
MRIEGAAQILIMLAIGAAAAAASFTHVHDLAASHGQGGWLAWADAVVLELMSVASGLEIRRRHRTALPIRFPACVLVCAAALSIAAQVAEAEASPIGWIAAALPALGFLVMVKIALAQTSTTTHPAHRQDTPPTHPGNTDECSAAGDTGTGPADPPPAATDRGLLDPAAVADVAHLLPAATTARNTLTAEGRSLSRETLTEQLRRDRHPISNARASTLIKILKANPNATPDQPVTPDPAMYTLNTSARARPPDNLGTAGRQ